MQARDQPFEGNRHINLNDEFIVVGGRAQGTGLAFDLIESFTDGRIIDMACLGEFGASGIPAEKLDAQPLLQGFHLVAYGRAGYTQLACRQPETSQPGRGFKSG